MKTAVVATLSIASLALATTALADREQVHLTRAGQQAARAAVLRPGDVGATFTGGARKPTLNTSVACPGFQPKQSDLVVVGAAETTWKSDTAQFDSEAQVLETPRMVHLDWSRTVHSSKVLPCLRRTIVRSLASDQRLSFVTRLPVAQVAPHARLFRSVIVLRMGSARTPILLDSLLLGKGRTEITLTTTAPYAARKSVTRAELRLARLLVRRAS